MPGTVACDTALFFDRLAKTGKTFILNDASIREVAET
jgi:hypothetical protein